MKKFILVREPALEVVAEIHYNKENAKPGASTLMAAVRDFTNNELEGSGVSEHFNVVIQFSNEPNYSHVLVIRKVKQAFSIKPLNN